MALCKFCGIGITWINKRPANTDGSNHLETCSAFSVEARRKITERNKEKVADEFLKAADRRNGFVITEYWLKQHRTRNGGWNAQQLSILGVKYPLPAGWLKRLIGSTIGYAVKVEFERVTALQHKTALAKLKPHDDASFGRVAIAVSRHMGCELASMKEIAKEIAVRTGWEDRAQLGRRRSRGLLLRYYNRFVIGKMSAPMDMLPAHDRNPSRNCGDFYSTEQWRQLRYQAIKLHGGACQCCGRKPPEVVLHVDHIKPRSLFPSLELDINNVQVLCEDCNLGKGAWDQSDWRAALDKKEFCIGS